MFSQIHTGGSHPLPLAIDVHKNLYDKKEIFRLHVMMRFGHMVLSRVLIYLLNEKSLSCVRPRKAIVCKFEG